MGLIFAPFACFVVSHRPKVLVSERSLHYATVAPVLPALIAQLRPNVPGRGMGVRFGAAGWMQHRTQLDADSVALPEPDTKHLLSRYSARVGGGRES
jgi:hypothetical protein